jgi:hypothetical protein
MQLAVSIKCLTHFAPKKIKKDKKKKKNWAILLGKRGFDDFHIQIYEATQSLTSPFVIFNYKKHYIYPGSFLNRKTIENDFHCFQTQTQTQTH